MFPDIYDSRGESRYDTLILHGERYTVAPLMARTGPVALWCEADECGCPADYELSYTDPWDGAYTRLHLCAECLALSEQAAKDEAAEAEAARRQKQGDARSDDATAHWESFPSPSLTNSSSGSSNARFFDTDRPQGTYDPYDLADLYDEDGSGMGAISCMTIAFVGILVMALLVFAAEVVR